jgi:hypothetical protein
MITSEKVDTPQSRPKEKRDVQCSVLEDTGMRGGGIGGRRERESGQ